MADETIARRGHAEAITVLCVGSDAGAVVDRLGEEREALSFVAEPTAARAFSRLGSESHVDCVVSEYRLPERDGIGLLRRVREEFDGLPFVLLAREGSEEVAAAALNADADGYFRGDAAAERYSRLADRIETVVDDYRTRRTRDETRKRLLELAESSSSAVWLFTGDWSEAIYVNSVYEDLWGRSIDALEADPTDFLEGVHPDARPEVAEAMETLSNGEPVELEYRVNPEEDYERWVEVQGEPVFDDAGNVAYVAGYARDITDRTERQRELQEKTRQLRGILDSIEASVFMVDPDGRYLLLNQASRERFGVAEDEDVVGKRFEEVVPERMAAAFRDNIEQALDAGETVEIETELPTDGETKTFLIRISPIYDESGDIYACCGFGTDITELKRREQQVERRNEEMEVFNSLLRHDVLNGITVIRARADALAADLDGEHRQYAETIVEWSDNITALVQRIRDVLDTLAGETPELERTNLSRRVREQVESVDRTYPAVEFETDLPEGVFVQANELLPDVFKNLLTNAVEHNEPEGLRVEVGAEVEADTVTVSIADNGRGVADELKEEVFRRGRTGHVKETGSGFGLFFVDAMVTAYGGDVRVEDNEMGGATFVLGFPRADG